MRGCHGLRFSAFLLALLLPEGPLAYKNSNGTSITFSCTSSVALTKGNNDFIYKFLNFSLHITASSKNLVSLGCVTDNICVTVQMSTPGSLRTPDLMNRTIGYVLTDSLRCLFQVLKN